MILWVDYVILSEGKVEGFLATSGSSSESMVRFLFFFFMKESKREDCLMAPTVNKYKNQNFSHTKYHTAYNLNAANPV